MKGGVISINYTADFQDCPSNIDNEEMHVGGDFEQSHIL